MNMIKGLLVTILLTLSPWGPLYAQMKVINNSGTEIMRVTEDGKVGFFTDNPQTKIHIVSSEDRSEASRNYTWKDNIVSTAPVVLVEDNSQFDIWSMVIEQRIQSPMEFMAGPTFKRGVSQHMLNPEGTKLLGNAQLGSANKSQTESKIDYNAVAAAVDAQAMAEYASGADYRGAAASFNVTRNDGTNDSHFYSLMTHGARAYFNNAVCIGGDYPGSTNKLSVNGEAAKPGGGTWAGLSDGRYKDIKNDYTSGLSAINEITPIKYSYTPDNPYHFDSNPEYIGAIAQQVQKVVPEAVHEDPDGNLIMQTDVVIWTMLNAIKELNAKVENLSR